MDLCSSPPFASKCPCCHKLFHESIQSIDEAILLGEANTLRTNLYPALKLPRRIIARTEESIERVDNKNKVITEKLEAALLINPKNFDALYLLYRSCCDGRTFLIDQKASFFSIEFYTLKLFSSLYKLLDKSDVRGFEFIRSEYYYELAGIFHGYNNFPASLNHAKLAYQYCLQSSDHDDLPKYKAGYLQARASFAKLPPLRFAVGDEVKFLQEHETGSKWKLGKVVELYYRERDFAITFNAPYRLQLLDDNDGEPPMRAYVKADLDCYVRKVGVRSIEITRYQARLDAKVKELARVFCSEEYMEDIHSVLAQDQEFADTLLSVWQIELSVGLLHLFRALVMLREPMVRTDTGYHMPSSEEVIAGIRAFFDPALCRDATPSAEDKGTSTDLERVRTEVLGMLRGTSTGRADGSDSSDSQWNLLHSIRSYISALTGYGPGRSYIDMRGCGSEFTVPSELSVAFSKVSILPDLNYMLPEAVSNSDSRFGYYLVAWIDLHSLLESRDASARSYTSLSSPGSSTAWEYRSLPWPCTTV